MYGGKYEKVYFSCHAADLYMHMSFWNGICQQVGNSV